MIHIATFGKYISQLGSSTQVSFHIIIDDKFLVNILNESWDILKKIIIVVITSKSLLHTCIFALRGALKLL